METENSNLCEVFGVIDKFVFQNHENGFAVLTLQEKTNSRNINLITVKGIFTNVQVGQEVKLKGLWVFHPKFGKQFEAKECMSLLPTTITGLKKYLGSGLIKGIGPIYADKLVRKFGLDILGIIDEAPERLNEIEGFGPKRIEKIKIAWKDQKEIANLLVFLQEKGISQSLAGKIYKHYKNQSIAVLNDNPYKLADEVWGIGFRTADEIAQKLGFDLYCKHRIYAGIIYIISLNSQQGSLYIEVEVLKNKIFEILQLNKDDHSELIKQALIELHQNEKVKLVSKGDNNFLTLSSHLFTEKSISEKIKKILDAPHALSFDIDHIYNILRVAQPGELYLNENQQKAVLSCFQNKITIITGGPGTGKTTVIKKLLSILDKYQAVYKLAAPTGRAAKRMIEATGKFAMTIHRLLEFDGGSFKFHHNETNSLKADFLILDEASMIDIFLAHNILKSLSLKSHLILIGDIDQLPSVGPGNFLNNLIASGKIAVVRLTQVFRQAQDSLIILNAHKINNGEFPKTNLPDCKNDFLFIKEENPELIGNHLKNIFFVTLKKYGLSHDDSILLAPMNKGNAGTIFLNNLLQSLLNPEDTPFVNHQGTKFKVNDKVMQIRNNYDKKVYNGDIGVIRSIDTEDREIIVSFSENSQVVYDFNELDELLHAFAISIHKSQGSEYSVVIVPLFMQHFILLQRNLIYTAITRAKKLCIFIGQTKALAMAIKNNKNHERITFLNDFLTDSPELKIS